MKNKPILGLVLFIAVIVIYGIVGAQALTLSNPTAPLDNADGDVPLIATSTPEDTATLITLELYKKKIIDTVALTATAVLEDSRCPADVQCVWAGRVLVSLDTFSSKGSASKTVTIGDQITLDSLTFTLKDVTPYPNGRKTTDAEYRFTFGIEKKV